MHKHLLRTIIALTMGTLVLTASGCYNQFGDNRSSTNYGSTRDDLSPEQNKGYSPGASTRSVESHDNTKLEFSQSISREVEALNGVNSAIVMLTDRNIYCAIMIDGTAAGTTGGSGKRKETNNSGTSLGRYNPFTFNQYADPNDLATGINNYETVEDPDGLSRNFTGTIADTIRRSAPAGRNIYVTANRDFINQLNSYAQESWSGRPLDTYVDEFNRSAELLFNNSTSQPVR